jgi:hypothetical protein
VAGSNILLVRVPQRHILPNSCLNRPATMASTQVMLPENMYEDLSIIPGYASVLFQASMNVADL